MVVWNIEKDYCNEDFMYSVWLTYQVNGEINLKRIMDIDPWN